MLAMTEEIRHVCFRYSAVSGADIALCGVRTQGVSGGSIVYVRFEDSACGDRRQVKGKRRRDILLMKTSSS